MSDSYHRTLSYTECDWLHSIEDECESDVGSRSTSSTLSWTDDGEREISEEMKNQFELFESALYSELEDEQLPEPILKEVAIWKQHSPHLRVVGTQINPTYSECGEVYPENYEEVFAQHSDHNGVLESEIVNDFNSRCNITSNEESRPNESSQEVSEAIVEKLFDKIWPDIMKNVEPIVRSEIEARLSRDPSPKILTPRRENKSFRIVEDNLLGVERPRVERRIPLSSRSCLNRHEYKCNHILDRSPVHVTIQHYSRQRKLSPAVNTHHKYPSSYSASRVARRTSTTVSARLPKRKSLVNEYIHPNSSHKDSDTSDSGSVRHGILPPIQAIPITPKLLNKRANSAMMRFSKTLPRTRPNTSRNKALYLTPIDDSDNSDKNAERGLNVDRFPRGDGHLSPLAPSLPHRFVPKQNKQLKNPQRWRY